MKDMQSFLWKPKCYFLKRLFILLFFLCYHQGYFWDSVAALWIHCFRWPSFYIFSFSYFSVSVGQRETERGGKDQDGEIQRETCRPISQFMKCTPVDGELGLKPRSLHNLCAAWWYEPFTGCTTTPRSFNLVVHTHYS